MKLTPQQLCEFWSAISDAQFICPTALSALMQAYVAATKGDASSADVQAKVRSASDTPSRTQVVGQVAVIPITGPMAARESWYLEYVGGTSTETVLREFRASMANPEIKAVMFYVDSPGGSAIGNEEVSLAIRAARGSKPIGSFVKGYAASAAYYVASAADQIFATPSSIVGSIGSIVVHQDMSKMLADYGITATIITNKASPAKGMGNPYKPLGDAGMRSMGSFVDAFGEQFIEAVASNRGTTRENVVAKFGQGDVYLADEAASRGMVDHVVPDLEVAIAKLTAQSSAASVSFAAPVPPVQSGSAVEARKPVPKEISQVNPKIKAALFARGLIASVDASDEACNAALAAFYAGRGVDKPASESEILSSVMAPAPAAAVAPNVAAAHAREMEEARKAPKLDAVQAIELRKNLQASAKVLNRGGEIVTSEQIDAAVEDAVKSGASHGDIVAAWTTKAPAEKGVARVESLGDGSVRYMSDAADALVLHAMASTDAIPASYRPKDPSSDVVRMSHAPLIWHAKQCLQMAGVKVPEYGVDNEQIALMAMQTGGGERHIFRSHAEAGMDAPAFNRPGDFPNLLSNLANKMLDMSISVADGTYEQWTGVWRQDLPDFKPASVSARSQPNELNEVLDSEESKELRLQEELLSYIFLRRFSNKVGLTPVLLANDDLGAFVEDTIALGDAYKRTQNTLCLNVLTSNAALLDGVALFHDGSHGNDIGSGSGAAPSETSANTVDLKFMAQTGVGGVGRSNARFSVALIPPAHRQAAVRSWAPLGELPEAKVAATNDTVSTYRGMIRPIVEPALQDYSNAIWYAFADPARQAAIVRAYFRGWGKGGQRQRWYDPGTKTTWIELEGRFGVAARNYRYVVRNNGS